MHSPKVKTAFNQQVIVLPIQNIVPQREILASYRKSTIYLQISSSLEHVGLIEPLVVFPKGPNEYLLLDGHVRLDILKRSSAVEVRAIFATDDEAYTYNKRVNHAPPVAQHFMILKALKNGLSEERIAAALNVNVGSIRKKRDMLDGICPEAIELLRNSHMTADAFAVLRKMKPIRQIEAAEHMAAGGTYTPVLKAEQRIALFRSLFHGRDDVYAVRWENADGRSGYMPKADRDWKAYLRAKDQDRKKVDRLTRKFRPLTDEVVRDEWTPRRRSHHRYLPLSSTR